MAGRRDTGLAALAGLAAGAVTLGVGSLVALLTGPSTDPLVAVGSAFVDATPAWLKDFAASTFGTADKVVLGIGEVRRPARARRAGRGARRPALGVGRDARRACSVPSPRWPRWADRTRGRSPGRPPWSARSRAC